MHVPPVAKELLIKSILAASAARGVKQSSSKLGFYAAAGAIALIAFVFFSIAGYYWLLQSFETPVAALITGVAIAAVAVVIAVIGHQGLKKPSFHHKKPMFNHDDGLMENVEGVLKSVWEHVGEPVKENPKIALLLALLAGALVADRISEKLD